MYRLSGQSQALTVKKGPVIQKRSYDWISHTVGCISTVNHLPVKPPGQVHIYPSSTSVQIPPFSHGSLAHSSMFTSQEVPKNPGRHAQSYPPTLSVHVAPFRQGALAHSSVSISQFGPETKWVFNEYVSSLFN